MGCVKRVARALREEADEVMREVEQGSMGAFFEGFEDDDGVVDLDEGLDLQAIRVELQGDIFDKNSNDNISDLWDDLEEDLFGGTV